MTNSKGGNEATFFSKYPNGDAYYRLRRYGNGALHIVSHLHGTVVYGDTDTGVYGSPKVWYWLRIVVENTGTRIAVRATVRSENSAEPAE